MFSLHNRLALRTFGTSFSRSIPSLFGIKASPVAGTQESLTVNSNDYFESIAIHPSTSDALYVKAWHLSEPNRYGWKDQKEHQNKSILDTLSKDEISQLEQCGKSLSFIHLSTWLMNPYDIRSTTPEYDSIYQSIIDDINSPPNSNKRILIINWWDVLAYKCEDNQSTEDDDGGINGENYQQEEKNNSESNVQPNFITPTIETKNGDVSYQVYFRPGLIKFLQYVTQHFYVGIENDSRDISICDCIEYINQEYLLKDNKKINFVVAGYQTGSEFGARLKSSLPDKDLLFMIDHQTYGFDDHESNSLERVNKLLIRGYNQNTSKSLLTVDNKLDIAANYLGAWNSENDSTTRETKTNRCIDIREDKIAGYIFDEHHHIPSVSYPRPQYTNPVANIYSDEKSFTKHEIYLSSYQNLRHKVSHAKQITTKCVNGEYQTGYQQIPFLYGKSFSRTAANSTIDEFVDLLKDCELNKNLPIIVVASEFFVRNWDVLTLSDFMGIYDSYNKSWLPKDKNKVYNNWILKCNNEIEYKRNDNSERDDQCVFMFELNPKIQIFLEFLTQNFNIIVWLENDCYRDWFEWINLQTLDNIYSNKTANGFYPNVSTIPFKGLISSIHCKTSMFNGKDCLQLELDSALRNKGVIDQPSSDSEKHNNILPFVLPWEYQQRFRKLYKAFDGDYHREYGTVHNVSLSGDDLEKLKQELMSNEA